MNQAGTEVYFNRPKTIEAMAFWRNLRGGTPWPTPDWRANWPQLSRFLEGNTAIIQHTTGNLTNVRERRSSHSALRVSPARTRPTRWSAAATCISFKNASPAEREASLRFAAGSASRSGPRLVHADRLYCHQPCRVRKPDDEGLHRQGPGGQCRAHLLPVATGRIVGAREPALYKALDR